MKITEIAKIVSIVSFIFPHGERPSLSGEGTSRWFPESRSNDLLEPLLNLFSTSLSFQPISGLPTMTAMTFQSSSMLNCNSNGSIVALTD